MEEMHEARYGERVQSSRALSRHLHVFTNLGALGTLSSWAFVEMSYTVMID